MKKILLMTALLTSAVAADTYSVRVKRLDSNLYQDLKSKMIIETKYCYEYAHGDDAVLYYDRYSYDNKIIFRNSGTVCEVKAVR